MTKPMIRIHNVETDSIVDREMTAEEYAVHLEQSAALAELKVQAEAKAQAKSELLSRLGITAEEAELLLG
jgi:hypothetical protein